MKKVLLTILLLSTVKAFSQCKQLKDEFTGHTSTVATVFLLPPTSPTLMQVLNFTKDESGHKIALLYTNPTINRDIRSEHTSILLKLEDDRVLRFPPQFKSSVNIMEGQYAAQQIFVESAISEEELDLLASKRVAAIRLGLDGDSGVTLSPINGAKKNQILSSAKCIK